MKRKWLENPGGGISRIEELTPADETEETDTKIKETLPLKQEKKDIPKKKLAENGQTFLDISKGDITITENGAVGGGLLEDETKLNQKGYWITGTTDAYRIVVEKDVITNITLDNVNITCSEFDCINVSHADVTITLIGTNELFCNSGTKRDEDEWEFGCALAKDGMEDKSKLVLQCEFADERGHRCDKKRCGSLLAKGGSELFHAGAIGSTMRNVTIAGESGFANFTIKGGNIEASAGIHGPGIGSACVSERHSGGYTKNIRISGGNVTAIGTEFGSGIGSGGGNTVDGIYITGGFVEAKGGQNAPGIGASYGGSADPQITKNVIISGGDTVVKAIGDKNTSMPGIGSGGGNDKVSNVKASPDFGFQGYVQDGTSEKDYTFMDGTPFKQETAIEVGKFYTMVYFGPFRDTNEIEKDTKDQIGANHVISKTGGEPFGENQLKGLTMVTGKNEDGKDFSIDELTFTKLEQIQAINRAKKKGETGEYPLTFQTPNGTQTTVTVYLKGEGTDAAQIDPERLEPTIGADGFQQDTGGEAFSEEDVRDLAQVQGKNKEGTTYPREDFTLDAGQLEAINHAKTSGKGGTFELTFTSPDGKKATVEVVLKAYDETTVDEATGEQIKGVHIISRTGGKAFTKEQLKDLSDVTASSGSGEAIERNDLVVPNEEQIKAINEAKTSGKTGDFPLTIETPDGTGITIQVSLRDSGTDQTGKGEDGGQRGSLGANDTEQPTGGKRYSEEEVRELCKAKGKDIHGNSVTVKVDEGQLKQINEAKTKGKTGTFGLTFSLEDGTRAEVTVTLTGDHTVTFDPDGGDYQPKDQIVVGGRVAVEPREPKKEGSMFEGWYYTDETGNEVKWDFDTPVHQSMTLKARWKKEAADAKVNGTTEKKKAENKKDTDKWKYREIGGDKEGKEDRAAKTGDENRMLPALMCTVGMAGVIVYLLRRKKIK